MSYFFFVTAQQQQQQPQQQNNHNCSWVETKIVLKARMILMSDPIPIFD